MIPIPQYPIYSASVEQLGGQKVGYYLDEKNKWNLSIDELRKMLELCGLFTINNNIVKFVRSPSGYGCNFSWPVFLLENSLSNNYFSQMNLSRYNKKYQRNIYFIGAGIEGDTNSTQFQY